MFLLSLELRTTDCFLSYITIGNKNLCLNFGLAFAVKTSKKSKLNDTILKKNNGVWGKKMTILKINQVLSPVKVKDRGISNSHSSLET